MSIRYRFEPNIDIRMACWFPADSKHFTTQRQKLQNRVNAATGDAEKTDLSPDNHVSAAHTTYNGFFCLH